MRRYFLTALAFVALTAFHAEALTRYVCINVTGNGTWTVPSDFTNTNTFDLISGGGGASQTCSTCTPYVAWGAPGGGAGHVMSPNQVLTPGATLTYHVGAAGLGGHGGSPHGGDGEITWICKTNLCITYTDSDVFAYAPPGYGGVIGDQSENVNAGNCGSPNPGKFGAGGFCTGGGGGGQAFNRIGGGGGGGAGGLAVGNNATFGGYGPDEKISGAFGAGGGSAACGTGSGSAGANASGAFGGAGGVSTHAGCGNGGAGGSGGGVGIAGADGTAWLPYVFGCKGPGGGAGGAGANSGAAGKAGGDYGGGGGSGGGDNTNGGNGGQGVIFITYTSSQPVIANGSVF